MRAVGHAQVRPGRGCRDRRHRRRVRRIAAVASARCTLGAQAPQVDARDGESVVVAVELRGGRRVGSTRGIGRGGVIGRGDRVLGGHHRLLGRRDGRCRRHGRQPATAGGRRGATGSAIATPATCRRMPRRRQARRRGGPTLAARPRAPARCRRRCGAHRHGASASMRTAMTDAPASTTRSAQVETPVARDRRVADAHRDPTAGDDARRPPSASRTTSAKGGVAARPAAVSRSSTCGIGSSSPRCGHRATRSDAVVDGAEQHDPAAHGGEPPRARGSGR